MRQEKKEDTCIVQFVLRCMKFLLALRSASKHTLQLFPYMLHYISGMYLDFQ